MPFRLAREQVDFMHVSVSEGIQTELNKRIT